MRHAGAEVVVLRRGRSSFVLVNVLQAVRPESVGSFVRRSLGSEGGPAMVDVGGADHLSTPGDVGRKRKEGETVGWLAEK